MNVLITSEYSQSSISELEKMQCVVTYDPWTLRGTGYSAEEIESLLKEKKYEGFVTELDDVTADVIKANPQLKFIGVCRANPVNVDVQVAKDLNIPIFCTPGRNAEAVVEMLVGMVLAYYRHIPEAVLYAKNGQWNEPAPASYNLFRGNEIMGKKIGFVGFGGIGKRAAEVFDVFGAEVQFYDPYVKESTYKSVSLQDLFSTSDIVSVHLPVIDETRGLISGELLRLMKEDAIFVNTARSAVVDCKELYVVLSEKGIKGALLDVFETEPPTDFDKKLIALDNVVALPHICGATYEVVDHQSVMINKEIKKIIC